MRCDDERIRCGKCGMEFDSRVELAQHYLEEHPACNVKLF
jgi:hypothetical protein